ncbi:MAG: YIP1 family protein [Proteobacteria bacterium]|nr:YIP1 family protein [Pseudomonadota bacterium]
MDTPDLNTVLDFEPEDFLTSLFRTAKAILLSPGLFFQGMKRDGGLRNPLIFLASCVVVNTLLVALLLKSQSLIARSLVLGIVLPFVTAGVLYFIITRLFKASGTYEAAFRVNAYSAAVALLSWIPLVGVLLELYRIYLIVLGLSFAFSIKASRAFLAVILTVFVYLVASAALTHITGGQWPNVGPS